MSISSSASIKSRAGYSLVELLIVLSIAAIVLALGVPSMRLFVKDANLSGHTVSLLNTIIRGRNEALSRASYVTLCAASEDLASCKTSGANWSDGWLLFVDQGVSLQYDEGDTLLQVKGASDQVSVVADSGLGTAISFSAKGFAQSATSTTAGRLIICDDRKSVDKSRAIIVNRLGNSSLSKTVADASTACG